MEDLEALIGTEEGLARLQAGDDEIVRAVARTYLRQLVRTALGAGFDEQEAEDVVQETFVTFLEKVSDFEGRSKVRTYLFGILYRKIHEARRTRKREQEQDDIDEVFESRFDETGSWGTPPVPVDASLFDEQVRAFLKDCMEALSDLQRRVFVLKEVEEIPSKEVCNILEVTRTNMGVLLHRARNSLRECLEERGVERS